MLPPELISDFEQSLNDCQQLYLTAGRDCVDQYPHVIDCPPRDFLSRMNDLHRGLLLKIYLEVVMSDHRWTEVEQELARRLFKHIWNRDLEGEALREATIGLNKSSRKLSLASVVRPFVTIAPLRERGSQVATVVIRLANIIAKADGTFSTNETRRIRNLQQNLDRLLRPQRPNDPSGAIRDGNHASQAVEQVEADARQIHHQYDLADESSQTEIRDERSAEQRLDESLKQLDDLIGLDRVKKEVRTLANFLKVQEQRVQAGLPRTPLSLHMVFTGNPGTGKTTVARIVGQIFGAMGILKKGHLIETDRSGLVAEYAGQTAPKTNEVVDQALDGILFIDEAYSLIADQGDDAFGHEAVQTLLKRMEDERDRLVVIMAGYPDPILRLLKSNPGLSSRFSRTLHFPDYRASELGSIFEALCGRHHYELAKGLRHRLLLGLDELYRRRDKHFGNGRLVRNIFESAIRGMANRIASTSPLTHQLLTELTPEDIQFEDVSPDVFVPAGEVRYHVVCEGCQKRCRLSGDLLGQKLQCPSCHHQFFVAWAEPVRDS